MRIIVRYKKRYSNALEAQNLRKRHKFTKVFAVNQFKIGGVG